MKTDVQWQGILRCVVHGPPQPKGSMSAFPILRAGGRQGVRVTHSVKSKHWERHVRDHSRNYRPPWRDVPIQLNLTFHLPRPRSVKRFLPWVKPDLDKLARAVCDGLQGNYYKEDSQICRMVLDKVYADVVPFVEIEARRMDT